jgi:hypothetical protein
VNKLIDKAESTKAGKSASGLLTAAASESGFPADSDLVQGLKALAAPGIVMCRRNRRERADQLRSASIDCMRAISMPWSPWT